MPTSTEHPTPTNASACAGVHTSPPRFDDAAAILDALPERVVRYRIADLVITYSNASWRKLHRVDRAFGRSLADFLSEDGFVGLRRQLALLGPDRPVLTDPVPRSTLNEPDLWLEWNDRYIVSPDGPEVLSVGRDVTARRAAEMELAATQARFRELADHSSDIVWRLELDPAPRFDYISPSVENITGYPPEFFLESFANMIGVVDEASQRAIAESLAGERELTSYDTSVRRPDGSVVICETRATPTAGGVQGISRDVTEVRRLREQLTALASEDPLTGLPNRRRLDELLTRALAEPTSSLTIAYVDLDGLKQVNDRHGHGAGDVLLCGVAAALGTIGDDHVVARIGGDEFIVATSGSTGPGALADRIEAALTVAVDISREVAIVPRASIGVVTSDEATRSPAALIEAADRAMYVVKRSRKPPAAAG